MSMRKNIAFAIFFGAILSFHLISFLTDKAPELRGFRSVWLEEGCERFVLTIRVNRVSAVRAYVILLVLIKSEETLQLGRLKEVANTHEFENQARVDPIG